MYLGIDFGTSNSAVGLSQKGAAALLPLEGEHTTLPSALFYDTDKHQTLFGRAAIDAYIQHDEGRLLRSLKSILGSSLMEEATQIGVKKIPFKTILGHFLKHLKTKAEETTRQDITNVVLGRPVHYVDENEKADQRAQDQMEEVARACGFQNVLFQYEPVAAALAYEQTITKETLALIVDIGGGTSDFSIIRAAPERIGAQDRRQDILANSGVHIGGTDLDKRLSLHQIMPLLGYHTKTKGLFKGEATTMLPESPFHDLATWHKIVLMYNHKTISLMKDIRYRAERKDLIDRFIDILHHQYGHRLMSDVESAKIALSKEESFALPLAYIEEGLSTLLSLKMFEESIEKETQKIADCIRECLNKAGTKADQINTVFLTGGSTLIPSVERACAAVTPRAEIILGDRFGSVGLGLALDAQRRFQT